MEAASAVRRSEGLRAGAFLTALAALLTALACYALPQQAVSVDVICYFSAARILASGHSPYDLGRQAETQQALGWDRATNGFGVYDCLPYFYPPWFALACVPLLPLGYPAAKVVFFFLNVELALLSGYLLRDLVPAAPRRLPVVFLGLFIFSVVCALLGQTSLVVLFLAVLAWKLLDGGHDRAAGVVLALLTIKPQLTAVLLLGVLLWAVRRRRWGVLGGFTAALGLLIAACTLIVPTWPVEMLRAPGLSKPPTEERPWIGNTWFLLLRAAGAGGWGLWLAYLALAVPCLVAVVRAALDRARPVADVLATGLLTAFFIAPYARHYDFPVLAVPCLVLLGSRLPRAAGLALVVALVVVPYVQFVILGEVKAAYHPGEKFLYECSFFWVPAVLAAAWLAARRPGAKAVAVRAG